MYVFFIDIIIFLFSNKCNIEYMQGSKYNCCKISHYKRCDFLEINDIEEYERYNINKKLINK